MPNKYKRKTDRGMSSAEIYELAFEEVPSQVTDRILPNPETEQSSSVPQITVNPEERTPNPTIGTANNDDIAISGCNTGARTVTPSLSADQNMTSSTSSCIMSSNVEEPVASTSTARSPLATTSNVFSPESLRPLPKAPTRKKNQPNRRKIKSAVLTDTPTKDEIAAIEASKKIKNVKKRVLSEKKKKPKKLKKTNSKSKVDDEKGEAEENAENDCFCLCYLETFSNSKSIEKWVQCLECKGWAHGACTGGELQYVCHNCLPN